MRYFFLVTSAICAFSSFCYPIDGRVAARGIEYVEQDELPYDSEVEYIESKGTQYIDTGVIAQDGITASITVLRTTRTTNESFLGGTGSSDSRNWLAYSFSNHWYAGYGNDQADPKYEAQTNVVTTIETELVPHYCRYFIDGEYAYQRRYTNSGFYSGVSICMFAMGKNTAPDAKARGRIYRCMIFYYGELVRDFIPVRKHGIGYMYDNVTGELFGNNGTGEFIIGPDVH